MITIKSIKKAFLLKGYKLFENDSKPYNLNLIGIRSSDNTPNTFNDQFVVMYKFSGGWNISVYKCTTDPGIYWLKNPMNVNGTAILLEGQYPGMWAEGMHQGKYPALVQVSPVKVIRDFDRDSELDYNSGVIDEGLFGINGHRSNAKMESKQVDRWSAGCQVLANPFDFEELMTKVKHSKKFWGNKFTYTLLNERDLK